MKYLLDTNIVINYLRGEPTVVKYLNQAISDGLALSSISLAELFHGAYKSQNKNKNLKLIQDFIKTPEIEIIDFTREISQQYGQLMAKLENQGHKLSIPDTQIAATALSHKLTILTQDKKHFTRLTNYQIKLKML